jgi:hypothetical protein
MDKMLKAYLARAAKVIGERTEGEVRHDDAVVAALNEGRSITEALALAAARVPAEAIRCDEGNVSDIAAHYEYLKEHAQILKALRGCEEINARP